MPRVNTPGDHDAATLAERVLGSKPTSVQRFATGLCHRVFDVALADGRRVVVRMTTPELRKFMVGGVRWHRKLQPLGVPLPALLHSAVNDPFPSMILDRLPGTDLGNVYASLHRHDRAAIAAAVVDAQRRAAQLPATQGFGFVTGYDDPSLAGHPKWANVIDDLLDRARERIAKAKLVDPTLVDRVDAVKRRFEAYLARVKPIAFLPDTTTKNVLVHERKFSGIVDVDEVCFGDPLLALALTKASLIASSHELDYVAAWQELLDVSGDARGALEFYTAVFLADFLGELGHAFNRDAPAEHLNRQVTLEHRLKETLAAI